MLHVHRAERADGLVSALAELLDDPLPDPFAAEVVCVPTRGMERWLTQRRARGPARDLRQRRVPVAAAAGRRGGGGRVGLRRRVRPVAARADGVAAAGGRRRVAGRAVPAQPRRAPRRRDARSRGASPPSATWPGCSTATRCSARRCCAPGRSGATSTRTAAGLPADAAWQAELWRRLRERIGHEGPAERLEAACARLAADPAARRTCPARLSLFGLTRLPAAHLSVLRALATAPRRAPVPAAPVARAVGEARRATGDVAAALARHDRRRWWRTGCWPPGAATRASCSS